MIYKDLSVKDLGEKRIIKEIIKPIANDDELIGIGDDAAMVDIPPGHKIIVSTDKIPEDLLALQLGLMNPKEHGRYLAVANISDVVAMGAKPTSLLVTAALPNDFKVTYLKDFFEGVVEGCKEYDVKLVGGDLGWATSAMFSATSIGHVFPDKVIKRSTIKNNDLLFVSNEIGLFGSALIYYIVAKPNGLDLSNKEEEILRNSLCKPKIPLNIVKKLVESKVCTSLMDITDGVGMSVIELSNASKINFIIDEGKLPINPITKKIASFLKIDYLDIVFGIGLDLEVMGTTSTNDKEISGISHIGIARSNLTENTVVRTDGSRIKMPNNGWQHFSTGAMDQVKNSVK